MLEQAKITSKQIILLIFLSRIILSISFLPVLRIPPANQDVWLTVLTLIPFELLLSVPIYLLAKRFPNQSIIQYSQTLMGKPGKIIGILCCWFFIHITSLNISYFCAFLTTAIMPETPSAFFSITLLTLSAFMVRKGIEVIVRVSEFFTPIIVLIIVMLFVFLIKEMEFTQLSPVIEMGILPILYGGFYSSVQTVEILCFAMILPYLNSRQKLKETFILSYILISFIALLIVISILTTYGSELGKSLVFPFFNATRIINIGDFIERVEMFHVAIWIIGVFIKVCFFYYLAVLGVSQVFKLADHKPLVLPIGTIIISFTFMLETNILELVEFSSYKVFTWYALLFILIIPSILLLISWIRKKGEKQR